MSRVYDTPRYEDQTLNKVLMHIDVASYQLGFENVRYCFGNSRALLKNYDNVKYELQQLDLINAEEINCIGPDEIEDMDLYTNYYVGDAVSRQGLENLMKTVATGKILYEILYKFNTQKKKIWCDYDASIRIMHGYLTEKYKGNLSDKDWKLLKFCDVIAQDICSISLAACRMGSKILDIISNRIVPQSVANKQWLNMICWNRGMELTRLKSMTPEAISGHEELRNGSQFVSYEAFNVSNTKAARTLGVVKMYRIMGLYVLEYIDNIYILDYSSLDQVHLVSKMWEGFYKYASNYRITGMGSCPREINSRLIDICKDWICESLIYTNFTDKLARSMKQSLALLQNDMHASAERLNVNLDLKSKKLRELIKEIIILPSYWHDRLVSLGVSSRTQLDLANMFYALPAPDCNLKHLFERASIYMNKAKQANSHEFHEFMNYCMAVDLCKAITIYKNEVKYETIDEYDIKTHNWYKSCMKGKLTLPPDEDMGKAWVSNFFPFNNTLPQWFWEASDVTHVLSDASKYDDLQTFSSLSRSSHNELLYALENAPKLSYKWDPVDVLPELGTGADKWDRMAVMAVKCENTKPGTKCRETWSADDITRELTTCYDRAAIPIASMYSGVTARKSDIEVQSIFDRIAAMTRRDNPKKVIIISNDVSGWSPLGDRDAWSVHHDYLIRMTKAPRNLKLKSIWLGISAYLAKRGVLASTKLSKGLFQGWTGTCDSIFNVHISLYCVRKAKRAGLLLTSESANTAGLIDDAVQAVELDPKSTFDHQQMAADFHFKTTVDTWFDLGAEIDVVKTLYSSCKFIYLNKFFCEGSEVYTPMKIFARADKEFNRRFATVFSQIDTVLGSYRSSVEKGCCPIVGYYFAISRCMNLVLYSNSSLMMKDACELVNAAFATRGLGGWGIPHITSWLTQEAQDTLSMYTSVMTTAIEICQDKSVSEKFNRLLIGTLSQEPAQVGIIGLIMSPLNVVAEGVIQPESQVTRKLKRGMITKCKSLVFKKALQAGESPEEMELISRIVKCARWDVAILELLGQCLPSTCSASLIDRAYKNELVTQLFPFRIRSEMSSIIRKGSGKAVIHLMNKNFPETDIEAKRSNAYTLALDCRSRFYEKNEIEIANHTIPDYGTCLARQYPGENPGLIIKSKWPKYSCETDKSTTRNMYDGIPHKEKTRTPKSTTAYTFTGERYRYMTPVQKCICKAAVVSAYLTSNGGNGQYFWDLVTTIWGAKHKVTPPIVTTQIKPGTSTKRLSAAKSHLTHTIGAFKNVTNCVEVIADPIGSYLSAKQVHVDYMSIVTAARFVGMMNLAISNGEESLEDLFFGFLEGSIPTTEEDKLTLFDEELSNKCIKELVDLVDPMLFHHVLESMKEVQYSRSEDEEYICIGFSSEHMGTARMGQEISISAGYLSNIIHCSVIAPTAVRKRTSMVRLAGDEVISRPTLKADTRYRQLTRSVPRSQAIVCLAMETIRDLCPGGLKMNIAQAPWRQVPHEFQATFPDWCMYWTNVVGLMKRYTMSLDFNICRALLGKTPHHIVNHLASLDIRTNDAALYVVSYLYLSSYGRLRTPESYTLTSALGIAHMSRIWGLAAKIRQYPSKKWKVTQTRERILMGEIYHGLSLAIQNYYNKPQVVRSIGNSIRSHFIRYFGGWEIEIPEIDNRFVGCEPGLNPHYRAFRDGLLSQIRLVGLDINYIGRELDQIANDIFTLGETKALETIEEPFLQEPLPALEPILHLPVLQSLEIEDQEMAEEPREQDQVILNATCAYMEQGIHFAILVYKGEETYDRSYDPDEDEINEFLLEMREIESTGQDGQAPDEAQ